MIRVPHLGWNGKDSVWSNVSGLSCTMPLEWYLWSHIIALTGIPSGPGGPTSPKSPGNPWAQIEIMWAEEKCVIFKMPIFMSSGKLWHYPHHPPLWWWHQSNQMLSQHFNPRTPARNSTTECFPATKWLGNTQETMNSKLWTKPPGHSEMAE